MKKLLIIITACIFFSACKKECKTPGQGTLTFNNSTNNTVSAVDDNGQEIVQVGAHSNFSGPYTAGCGHLTFGTGQNYCVTQCETTTLTY